MENEAGSEAPGGEFEDDMLNTLPKYLYLFTEDFYGKPSYFILMLKRPSDFYGCFELPPEILDQLNEEIKANT